MRPLLTAVLLVIPALAFALDGGTRPPWFEACGDDIMKLGCADKKGKEEVKACLDAHAAELSAKCKDFAAKNKK